MLGDLIDPRSVELRLAALALVLAIGAALIGNPASGPIVKVNTEELARLVDSEAGRVRPVELADWIVQQRTDYRLLDIRDAAAYAVYHIPTAESVAVGELADYPLDRNERVVLYAEGGLRAAQAWFLLTAQGFSGVGLLEGGLEAWKNEVLFPTLGEAGAAGEPADSDRARHLSAFFGGSPRGGGEAAAAAPLQLPQVEAPAAAPVVRRQRRAKEGC